MLSVQTKLKNLFKFSTPELPLQPLQEFKSYLCFINSLEIPVKLTQVVAVVPHRSQSIAGWQGLHSLTCLGEDRQLYDIDIRYAWGSEIFKNDL